MLQSLEESKAKPFRRGQTAVTFVPRSGLNRRRLYATVVATAALAGCAAPLSRQEIREAGALADINTYRTRAPEMAGLVSLADALDYASRYNIELWVAALEREFQGELATQAKLRMLPSLMGGVDASRRSELDASSSVSLDSGEQSLEPSYSSEQTSRRWDVSATWNLLDFGISFFRARQQASRVSIAAEQERRVRQNLALEVTRAYWQAVTAREVAREADLIAAEVAERLEKLRQEIAEQTVSQVDGLKRETSLLEQNEQLRRYERAYLSAKAELATLMGLPPRAVFALVDVDLDQPLSPAEFDLAELEWEALRARPELYQKDLEEGISRDEAHVALAQMFPSLSLFWRYDFDDSLLLAFNEWYSVGLRASWDLFTIPRQLHQHKTVKLQTELIKKRRTAVAVAILTQLHLALIDYRDALDRYQSSAELSAKRRQLFEAIVSTAEEGKSHEGEALDHHMRYLQARARYLAAYAGVMSAQARVNNTVGRDMSIESTGDAEEQERPAEQTQAAESAEE